VKVPLHAEEVTSSQKCSKKTNATSKNERIADGAAIINMAFRNVAVAA
jgi:hypothetical protein